MSLRAIAVALVCVAPAACRAPAAAGPAGPLPPALAGSAPAPAREVHRELLAQQDLPAQPGWESRLYLIDFPPLAEAPLHLHPVQCVGYVLEGSFESAFGDAAVTVKHQGESFADLADEPHRFRNPDPARPLRFLVSGTFRKGEPLFRPLSAPRVRLQSTAVPVTIAWPSLYPETVEVNPLTGKFLVSSIREGAVFEVGLDGVPRKLVQDERLTSILGIAVDPRSRRLLATNSDLGAGLKRSPRGPRKEAGVGIYDLESGRALHYVDLAPLVPEGDHLINGLAVDAAGNAYATDSFSPVIYKVDPVGAASVFLQDEEFNGPGINLNGVVYDPKGFLLVVKKSTGALYRVPIAEPRRFTRVAVDKEFIGGDGLLLVGDGSLVLVANQTPGGVSNTAFVLESKDGWATANVVESKDLGDVYPTSCAALGGKIYSLSSHLKEWIGAKPGEREAIAGRARLGELQEIGVIGR